jgi:cytochrome c peroxidase
LGGSATPINLTAEDRTKANNVFDHWGNSLDQYEASPDVSAFSSKFDAFSANAYTLTKDEEAGMELFNGKGNCNSCHVDGRGTTLKPGNQPDHSAPASVTPQFTCFGSANEGLPLNPRDAIYYQNTPDSFGFTANPDGFAFRDLGMGSFLRGVAAPNPNSDWTQFAPGVDGQFQVSTARNVAMTPQQCPTTEAGPAPYFQKGFFHNGYIKSLKQLVHFYNTRDKKEFMYNVTSGHCPAGTIEKVNCWPMPEVNNNIDMTTGNLGLTDREEDQIVAFLETLTDGFTRPYPDRDKFTGACMTCDPSKDPNCSPSRQGNGSLIPTPPLPPCGSDICGVAPVPKPPIP